MNATALRAELAALTAAAPSKIAAFAARRVARIAEIEAALLIAPEPEPADDPCWQRQLDKADAASPANRSRARWS